MSIDRVFETVSAVLSTQFFSAALERVSAFLEALRSYSTALSLLFLTGILYCFFRLEKIIAETYHRDRAPGTGEDEHPRNAALVESPSAIRWKRVQEHLASASESDWRLAVLEADSMLEEMVSGMGYRGESLGEKLKGIEKSDFTAIDKAWEAHGVRNRIAHEGAAFSLTAREAKRVIGLYEDVFKEFRYI